MDKENPKYCKICGKAFWGKTNNLTKHMREQHSTDEFLKVYKCEEVDKDDKMCTFTSQFKRNFIAHLETSHGYTRTGSKNIAESANLIEVKNQSNWEKFQKIFEKFG